MSDFVTCSISLMFISFLANADKTVTIKDFLKVGNAAEAFFVQAIEATHDKTSLSFTQPSQIH
jgi:hypothetical protein